MWVREARDEDLGGRLALAVAGLDPARASVLVDPLRPVRVALCCAPGLAEAERRALDFTSLARLPVRARSLRPLSSWSRRAGLPGVAHELGAEVDRVVARARAAEAAPGRLPRGRSIVELSLPEDAEGIAALVESAWSSQVAPQWTCDPEALDRRLRDARVLGLTVLGEIVGVAALAITPPRARLRLWTARDHDGELLAQLLAGVEHRLRAWGLDELRVLDGFGPEASQLLQNPTYLETGDSYELLVGPREHLDPGDPWLDPRAWRLPR